MGREEDAADTVLDAATDQLRPVPDFNMRIEIASFGNLDRSDASRLTDVLQAEAARWHSVRLQVTGGVMLDWPGDDSAWASLDGELERLNLVARGVARAAQGMRLFVDRRRFRPLIKLGTVNDETTVPYLEALQTGLDAFTSGPWIQSSFSLLQSATSLPGEPDFRPYAEIDLGPR